MALVSPGLSITVTDESQYISNAVGTVPLVLLATAENKTINGTLATGTTETNAGALQVFGSQRELSTSMGYPTFQQSSAGTPLHGNELNEYGLMAAYSALGVTNQLYAIRADIDLNELQGTSVRPTQAVPSGTIWFDTADTTWGIYEWSQSSQSFNAQAPIVITSSALTANTTVYAGNGSWAANSYPVSTPLTSVGTIGQYAVVNEAGGTSRVWYKAGASISNTNYGQEYFGQLYNQWVLVGSRQWHSSQPAVVGTTYSPTLANVGAATINGTALSNINSGANVYTIAQTINAANNPVPGSGNIVGISADVVNGYLAIYSDGTFNGGSVTLAGNLWSQVGITASTYYNPILQTAANSAITTLGFSSDGYGNYVDVPAWTSHDSVSAPNGSVWMKQGATGGGSNFVFKQYNSVTGLWNTLSVNSYANQASALYELDPIGGGLNINPGTIFMHQDPNGSGTGIFGFAGYRAYVRTVAGAVSATGTLVSANPYTNGTTFSMTVSTPGSIATVTKTVTIGNANGGSGADFVAAVLAANFANVSAQFNASTNTVTLTHTAGGYILLTPTSSYPNAIANAGFVSGTTNVTMSGTNAVISGFEYLSQVGYSVGDAEPEADPANGTLWYYSDPTVVDIMVNTGSKWVGYKTLGADARGYDLTATDANGVIVAAVQPTTQTSGAALKAGDLWLNSSDLENWPNLSRYNGSNWIAIDNTDHISTNGILFADARWDNNGYTDAASGDEATVQKLLTSNYVDLDAPNPQLYPRGMLLLNTRRSGYNVKKFVQSYFGPSSYAATTASASTYSDTRTLYTYNAGATYQAGVKVLSTDHTTIYVVNTGTTATGVAPGTNATYWTALETNTWVTASGLKNDGSPNAGHYAQRKIIVSAMKAALDSNTQIREEQFQFSLICAPGYPELISDMVSLNNDRANTGFVIGDTPLNLSTNTVDINNWSNDTNGDGLSTNDPYLAVYYPGGLSTDLGGNSIMVPASHMALRTYLYNDNVAYPWFAPAGTRRGLVSNATDLGYVNYTTGEFIRTGVNQGLRDALYQLKLNPITIIPGTGIVVWGQKTRDPNTESMDRVNVARLVNYVRTIFANSGNAFLFEPNDKITRDQFAAVLNRALNDLVAKRGIYDYLVVCDTTNNTPDRIANNQLYADVAIEPMKDVEFIYIPIRLFNPGDIASLGGK